jgi:hypothetical protein
MDFIEHAKKKKRAPYPYFLKRVQREMEQEQSNDDLAKKNSQQQPGGDSLCCDPKQEGTPNPAKRARGQEGNAQAQRTGTASTSCAVGVDTAIPAGPCAP